jgi:large subunit ribosomal protein L18
MEKEIKQRRRYRRHKRVRAKIFGTAERPRLSVFRSIKHIYAQLIDDETGRTFVSASDLELKKPTPKQNLRLATGQETKSKKQKTKIKEKKTGETEKPLLKGKAMVAYEIGKLIAKRALKKKIEKAVFDRGGYQYHGRVKALAEGARKGGLKF